MTFQTFFFVSSSIPYLHRCLKTIDLLFETKESFVRVSKLSSYRQTQLADATPLCVENNTIFTQMLENNRPFIRNKRILCWGIKTAAESAILYYWPKCLSALARCLLKSMSAIDRIYCMLHAMQFSVYPITPHKGGPFYISLIRIFQTLPQSNNI